MQDSVIILQLKVKNEIFVTFVPRRFEWLPVLGSLSVLCWMFSLLHLLQSLEMIKATPNGGKWNAFGLDLFCDITSRIRLSCDLSKCWTCRNLSYLPRYKLPSQDDIMLKWKCFVHLTSEKWVWSISVRSPVVGNWVELSSGICIYCLDKAKALSVCHNNN